MRIFILSIVSCLLIASDANAGIFFRRGGWVQQQPQPQQQPATGCVNCYQGRTVTPQQATSSKVPAKATQAIGPTPTKNMDLPSAPTPEL